MPCTGSLACENSERSKSGHTFEKTRERVYLIADLSRDHLLLTRKWKQKGHPMISRRGSFSPNPSDMILIITFINLVLNTPLILLNGHGECKLSSFILRLDYEVVSGRNNLLERVHYQLY